MFSSLLEFHFGDLGQGLYDADSFGGVGRIREDYANHRD